MPTDDLQTDQLRALLEVVSQGSIRAAAQALGTSRATIRRRLAALESVVGCPLLEGEAPRATLTPAGEVVAEQGRRVVGHVGAMLSAARLAQRDAVTLTVVLPIGFPPEFSARALQFSHQSLPDIQWVIRHAADPLEHIDQGADVVFHFGPPPARDALYSAVVRRARLVLLANAAYLDRFGCPTELEDLADHTIAAWRGPGVEPGLLRLVGGGTARIVPRWVVGDAYILRQMAHIGAALVYGPDAGTFEEGLELVPVMEDKVDAEYALRVLLCQPSAADPKVAAALDAFREVVDAIPLS